MSKTIQEFTEAYDDWADDYDDDYDDDSQDSELYRESVSRVVEYAWPRPTDTVLDLGTGTGAIALALADDADEVIGRDISDRMLERAQKKAVERDIKNVTFGHGRFLNPKVERANIVVSNWAIHHLPPREQYDAIKEIATLNPRRVVLGAAMYFDDRDPKNPIFCADSVYPATVGRLVEVLTDVGFVVTDTVRIHDECGILVATSSQTN